MSGELELTVGDVPMAIAVDAARQPGFVDLVLHGTLKERHDFAKGYATRFGQMSFDADTYLRRKGWSDEHIHNIGNSYGFSPSWAEKRN